MRIVLFKRDFTEQNALLRRIAEALERLSPPLPAHEPPPYKADLSDLRVVDAEGQRVLEEVKRQFALDNNVMPDSEAFDKALKAYEDQIREWQGQDAVADLPWNRIGRVRE